MAVDSLGFDIPFANIDIAIKERILWPVLSDLPVEGNSLGLVLVQKTLPSQKLVTNEHGILFVSHVELILFIVSIAK